MKRSALRLFFPMTSLLTTLSLGCGPEKLGRDWQQLKAPIEAPNFALSSLEGDSVRLSDFRDRVVIMEFWATWCGPCQVSIPSLEAIYRKYEKRGVAVLLVNQGEGPEAIRRWARGRFTAPILLDRDGVVGTRYGAASLPRLIVINRQGQIAYLHSGYGGGLELSLNMILKDLLSPRPPEEKSNA